MNTAIVAIVLAADIPARWRSPARQQRQCQGKHRCQGHGRRHPRPPIRTAGVSKTRLRASGGTRGLPVQMERGRSYRRAKGSEEKLQRQRGRATPPCIARYWWSIYRRPEGKGAQPAMPAATPTRWRIADQQTGGQGQRCCRSRRTRPPLATPAVRHEVQHRDAALTTSLSARARTCCTGGAWWWNLTTGVSRVRCRRRKRAGAAIVEIGKSAHQKGGPGISGFRR